MTENKRYNITESKIIEDGFYIQDNEHKHSFPTTRDASTLVMYEKALNEQDAEIKRLKTIREEQIQTILKQKRKIKELETENKQLIKEWFESEKDYIIESYHDNAIRRDEKIEFLKEEFKARFGDVE